MKQKKKQAKWLGKRKWSAFRGSKKELILFYIVISYIIVCGPPESLTQFFLISL